MGSMFEFQYVLNNIVIRRYIKQLVIRTHNFILNTNIALSKHVYSEECFQTKDR